MDDGFRKIGVIGDVHAEAARLEILLHFFSSQELDRLFCVGDVVDGPGPVDRCCQLLHDSKVATVLGNHDQWCLENANRGVADATAADQLSDSSRGFLESLPRMLLIETARGQTMICHGLGECNMASVRPTDSMDDVFSNLELWAIYRDDTLRFVINGHSHRPDLRIFNHLTVINAGSLDTTEDACSVVVDFLEGRADFFRVDESGRVERCIARRCD